jgi:REP element-mobilizing transposase RayT
MANTYTSLHYHLVFSTKNRERWIAEEIEQRVWAYLAGVARENGLKAIMVGGIENHVHLLVGMRPTMTVSKALQLLKGASSHWFHETFPKFRLFQWQDGYGAFTVSKSQMPEVTDYIRSQREHHRTRTFEEEYVEFLRRHDVEFDERYVSTDSTVATRRR